MDRGGDTRTKTDVIEFWEYGYFAQTHIKICNFGQERTDRRPETHWSRTWKQDARWNNCQKYNSYSNLRQLAES